MDDPVVYDPCPRLTPQGELCMRPRYHRGGCRADHSEIEVYRAYAVHLREITASMTRGQLRAAYEFHRLAARILKALLNH